VPGWHEGKGFIAQVFRVQFRAFRVDSSFWCLHPAKMAMCPQDIVVAMAENDF
jgi:hypothetical protein